MHEEEIRLLLDQACNNPALFFQISQQPPYLYLFINRQGDAFLDYEALTCLLAETIADLELPNIDYLALYSRPWGEVDTDWQHCVALEEFVRDPLPSSSAEVAAESARMSQAMSQAKFSMPEHSLEDVTELVSSLASQPILGESLSSTWLESGDPMTIVQGSPISAQQSGEDPMTIVQGSPISAQQSGEDPMTIVQGRPISSQQSSEDPMTIVQGSPISAQQSGEDPMTIVQGRPISSQQSSQQSSPDLNSEDFSSYCFIRDRVLLENHLREIPPKVAKSVVIFHRFPTRGKHRVLPLLGQLFEGDRGIVFIHFPDQVQQWFEIILTLNAEELESAQIWFSRYCLDTSKTIRDIQFLMRIVTEPEAFVLDRPSSAQLASERSPSTKSPLLSFDARPQTVLPSDSADSAPNLQANPPGKPRLSVSAPSQSSDPLPSSSPRNLWIWFLLLGIGALFLGSIAGSSYGRGGTFWMWLTLLLAMGLETFSAATANTALRKLEGGLFTACWIIYLILPFGRGMIGGYLAGWLLGLGVGNILRQELASSRKALPQDLSGLAGLVQTKSGTIALATALIGFSIPLFLSSGGQTVSNGICEQDAILNDPNAYTYCSIATELVEDTSQLETAMKEGVASTNPDQLSEFCQMSVLTASGITTLDPNSTVEAQVIPIQGGLYASEILVNSPNQGLQGTCILANTATQVELLGQEIFLSE